MALHVQRPGTDRRRELLPFDLEEIRDGPVERNRHGRGAGAGHDPGVHGGDLPRDGAGKGRPYLGPRDIAAGQAGRVNVGLELDVNLGQDQVPDAVRCEAERAVGV